jgi:hypothetical protein
MTRSIALALCVTAMLAVTVSRPANGQGNYRFKQAWPVKWGAAGSGARFVQPRATPSQLLPAVQRIKAPPGGMGQTSAGKLKSRGSKNAAGADYFLKVSTIKGEPQAARKPHEIVVVGSRRSSRPSGKSKGGSSSGSTWDLGSWSRIDGLDVTQGRAIRRPNVTRGRIGSGSGR